MTIAYMWGCILSRLNRAARNVGLFVDWNTQIRSVPDAFKEDPTKRCQFALKSVGKITSKILCEIDHSSMFRVRMRLYHGWTTGVTQTANRRAFSQVTEFQNPDELFPSSRVISLTEIEFGDRLIDALPMRENTGIGIHLPNTYRNQGGITTYSEKMVDSALAVDLLSWARIEPNSIALVLSSDDDMIPPIFVAEAWMKPMGGMVLLARPPARGESRFLSLEGLLA